MFLATHSMLIEKEYKEVVSVTREVDRHSHHEPINPTSADVGKRRNMRVTLFYCYHNSKVLGSSVCA